MLVNTHRCMLAAAPRTGPSMMTVWSLVQAVGAQWLQADTPSACQSKYSSHPGQRPLSDDNVFSTKKRSPTYKTEDCWTLRCLRRFPARPSGLGRRRTTIKTWPSLLGAIITRSGVGCDETLGRELVVGPGLNALRLSRLLFRATVTQAQLAASSHSLLHRVGRGEARQRHNAGS